MVLIGQTMLECGMRTFKEVMGLRYVPVANVLKERQPNQSEAIINSQWQLLFRVLSCGWLKKYFDRDTIIYCTSSSNIGWIVILALALGVFSVLLARNPKVWGSIPHGDSEFFLCPTLLTRRKKHLSFFFYRAHHLSYFIYVYFNLGKWWRKKLNLWVHFHNTSREQDVY